MMFLRLALALCFLLVSLSTAFAQNTQCVTTALGGGAPDAIVIPKLPCIPTTTLLLLTVSQSNQTTTPTLQPTGWNPQKIVRFDGSPLQVGDLIAGSHVQLTNNGTNWFLLTLPNNLPLAQAYSTILPGYNKFFGDFSFHFWDSANIIPRLRPVWGIGGSGTFGGGYVNNSLGTLNGAFWMMAEAENILYWQWKMNKDPEIQARIQSQWNFVRSLYSPAQLSSANPNDGVVYALDDSATVIQFLVQVHEATGDIQALNDAYALFTNIQIQFADPANSGCGLIYKNASDPAGPVLQSETLESIIASSALYLYKVLNYPALLTYAQGVWNWINSSCAQHPYGIYYEGSDLTTTHSCYKQGISCADPSNIHIGGASAAYFGGELETLTLGAQLYTLTGASSYYTTVASHMTAMQQNKTFLRPGSNVGLTGNVFLNDRDPWSDGIGAQAFAYYVFGLSGIDPSNSFKSTFINTAQSIINSRSSGVDPSGFNDGYYTPDWSGPEPVGQLANGTTSAVSCPCTWAQHGVTGFSAALSGQFNPAITATGQLSGTTLTITSPSTPGTITTGQYVNGTGIPNAKFWIVSFGSGSGGAGTYNVSTSGSFSSQAVVIGGNQYDYCCNFNSENNQLETMANSGAIIQAAALMVQGIHPTTMGLVPTMAAVENSGQFGIDSFTTGLSHTVSLQNQQTITDCTSATAGAKTISLPGAGSANSGKIWVLKLNLSDGTVYTITPTTGTINGQSTYTISDVDAPAVWFVSDGISNWKLLS